MLCQIDAAALKPLNYTSLLVHMNMSVSVCVWARAFVCTAAVWVDEEALVSRPLFC